MIFISVDNQYLSVILDNLDVSNFEMTPAKTTECIYIDLFLIQALFLQARILAECNIIRVGFF